MANMKYFTVCFKTFDVCFINFTYLIALLYRSIFFNNVNGIILVHDLTNNKSLQNLNKWLHEVLNHESVVGLNSIKVAPSCNNSTNKK